MFRLLSAGFCISGCLLAQARLGRLEGCPDPAKLAPVLSKLQQQKWVALGVQDLADLWPVELDNPNTCEPHCQVLFSEDRIIDGKSECGASFRFDTTPAADGFAQTRLEEFVINYTARTARERNAAEKILMGAIRVGKDVKKSYGVSTATGVFPVLSWTDALLEYRSCEMSLQEGKRSGRWSLILELHCQPLK